LFQVSQQFKKPTNQAGIVQKRHHFLIKKKLVLAMIQLKNGPLGFKQQFC
jgi:hypothetical protein